MVEEGSGGSDFVRAVEEDGWEREPENAEAELTPKGVAVAFGDVGGDRI